MRLVTRLLTLSACAATIACGSIAGTYDRSRSLSSSGPLDKDGPIAVLGPREDAQFPGLATSIENAVREALADRRKHKVLSSRELYEKLVPHSGYMEHFGAWLGRYKESGFLEPKYMPSYGKATGVRYLVVLKDAEIRREKMDVRTAMEESDCGFGCVITDSQNIWGNRLIVLAEVHDLMNGKVVWKGVGEANAISSRISKLDFGVLQYNLKQPGMGTYSAQLVSNVANGIARGIEGHQVSLAPK